MPEFGGKNFGLVIAYVLPGFVALWGAAEGLPPVARWLDPSPTVPAGLEAIVFVLLASLAAGMTVSAARWAVIDTLHHLTGLRRPEWDDARLPERLQAYDAVVEWHYRHYQFHANMAVALAVPYAARWAVGAPPGPAATAAFLALEALFLATSRDNLRKYYRRALRLLGSVPRPMRSQPMSNGSHPPPAAPPPKPASETKGPPPAGK